MRIAIDHRTQYRFTEPQSRIVQLLRLTPQDSIDQTVVNWHIGVDCDVRLREARDGYGNKVKTLYAEGPLEGIVIHVQGEVLTAGEAGLVRGAHEPLPPGVFLRQTERTQSNEAIADFIAETTAGRSTTLDRLHALTAGLHDRFELIETHYDEGLTAAEVFDEAKASARDLAHVMLAAARSMGVPGRYVSGYHADDGAHPAPHAWVEVWIDRLGWVAFDPAYGISADTDYVRVAVAQDFTGASPVAGSRLGRGDETLDVQVEAMRADE